MKHTQGPWYAADMGDHQGLVISETTGENVAVTYNGDADANLIAAAPELLAALKRVAYYFGNHSGQFMADCFGAALGAQIERQIGEAIRKAEREGCPWVTG